MKNIALSADERLIEAARETARETARRRRTTLDQEFRARLERYAAPEGEVRARDYRRLTSSLERVSTGATFPRDSINER